MKKIFASLGVILLVATLGVAVVFAYGSYKDLELKKEEAKVADQKKNDNGNTTSEKEQQNQTSTVTTQQDNHTNEASNEKAKKLEDAYNINSNEAQILSNEIDKADTDGDGVITTKEMTPTLQQFAEEGKFQPAGGGTTAPNDIEENNNSNEIDTSRDPRTKEQLEAELNSESEVKSPNEPGSTSREITPETDPDIFQLED
ncbi:Uncharacterised protein [Staphylococcus aureus]|uniref:hypothetical protein n=1 Tax=Staphylococcus aureus TaxID=1280 RepID=UPI00044536A1|nr:hypothetical protein [Staphylococcus aureus]EZV35853.1 hypothetical protein U961_02506 [Staphylococcus aureus 150211/pool 1]CAC8512388.1 Uncharacterised protein [Staphylococcus aureus]CAC8556224.1 Uncharacterised protein [Staphylococcus aureus]